MLEGQFQTQNDRLVIIEKPDIFAEGRPDSVQYIHGLLRSASSTMNVRGVVIVIVCALVSL